MFIEFEGESQLDRAQRTIRAMLKGQSPEGSVMSRSSSRCILVLVVSAATTAACASGPATPSTSRPAPDATRQQQNSVASEAIKNSPGEPIEKVLAGRVAGVQLGRASDGSLPVQIRGATSWNTDTQPLYVIHGVPIVPGPGGALSGINPYDIEKIEG